MRYILYLIVAICFQSAYAGSYDEFFSALVRDDGPALRQLVARGFDPNARDPNGQPAVTRALLVDSPLAALTLVQLPGFDPNALNRAGETPLMMAALKGQQAVCEALLERGAALNRDGWTPAHYAAAGNALPVLQLLLARGAAVDARAPNGRTPLMMAAQFGSDEVIDTLLAASADAAAKDLYEITAAELARRAGRASLAGRLEAAASAGKPSTR